MNDKEITNYIFELGTLKRFAHSGTKMAGVKHPDTVSEHVQRGAVIAYILAKLEKADAEKAMLMSLLHDNAEARITDLHKVARRYIDSKESEKKAFREQCDSLPKEIGKTFNDLFLEYEDRKTPEAIIARDADLLETAFQAKEYVDIGYTVCREWIDNVGKCLKTRTAKKIHKRMKKTNFADWWRPLTKIDTY